MRNRGCIPADRDGRWRADPESHPGGARARSDEVAQSGRNGAQVARDDLIQATGSVEKILGGGRYQISLDSGQTVTAQLSGRMRRFRIRVIPGDRVQVGLSPYDPTHGFITFRLREGESPPGR
jgi:translation initiation factor IF-1